MSEVWKYALEIEDEQSIAFSAGGVIHPETSTLGGAGCSDWL